MKVLVVDDDIRTATFIRNGLTQAGFVVDHEGDGSDGLHRAVAEHYDAAVIDIMLPSLDGLSLVRELRQKKIRLPVLILSAKRSVQDRVQGLYDRGGRLSHEAVRIFGVARQAPSFDPTSARGV
jgi:two-component system OmpR family response regulator